MEDDVLGFEVSVDDLIFVHVIEGFEALLDDVFGKGFGKFAFFFQVVVELAGVTQFKHEVDEFVVAEKCVQLDDVGMGEEALDLDFADELNQEFLIDFQLVYAFNSTDEAGVLVSGNEDLTELA